MHLNIAMRRNFVHVRTVLAVLRAWSLLGETKEPLRKKTESWEGAAAGQGLAFPPGICSHDPLHPQPQGLAVHPPRGVRLLPRERCRGWGTQRLGCTGVCWGVLGCAGVYWGALGCRTAPGTGGQARAGRPVRTRCLQTARPINPPRHSAQSVGSEQHC